MALLIVIPPVGQNFTFGSGPPIAFKAACPPIASAGKNFCTEYPRSNKRIISVDVTADKLETARSVGATDTINGADTDAVAAIHEMTKGGVDYAFECIGLKATCEQAWAASKLGGTTVIVGMMPFGEKIEIPGYEVFMMEKRLQGSMMGSNSFRVDMPRYVDMYLDGRLMLDEMISSHIHLEQINEGYEQMRQRVGARTVIDFS